ncbi:hypothetical protein G6F68_018360 [Rhizopus microsporus]|nr:hypothetical protein G6F68_018360 [Rhizopus microsporus]
MRSSCSRMATTSRAASGVFTVIRTSSEPASASSLTWIAVAMASAVSVLVMDCTTTGASPPTITTRSPHFTATERVARRIAAPTAGGGASWQGKEESCIGGTGTSTMAMSHPQEVEDERSSSALD